MQPSKPRLVDSPETSQKPQNEADERRESNERTTEEPKSEEEDEADRNMAATIACEEVFAVPNELIASEIVSAAGDVVEDLLGEGLIDAIGDGVADVLGDGLMDILGELGVIELVVGEGLNHISGNLSGTLAGLTFSAYRCGAYLAPTLRSLFTLLLGMAGGLGGSYSMRVVGTEIGAMCGDFHDLIGSDLGELIGKMFFGAVGAFVGRYTAIRLAQHIINNYWPPAVHINQSKSKVKQS
ncbi:uncharacterized protein LOC119080840 isoform X1 [Bradysia coprophila]|uniref:uncharacterized protein LOC119080840 isoform X1 n=2 Tax=Bradysia coprophila TaxID=38358 RepID=UPI00187DAF87|nr:uncharacterized protein LOC119080840 isoform X1 [Bradysia coprophila]XP_037045307.1 uncharacterized protein LOC119080840 isoform X1 [Bradysia coprophila]XP_037045317.1 uncharacterized protein LOC119080840 isoform X1 [Bradysia coprophila]XP_037045325.1 uncharacterized protein LOC119080840 isoform X1 [Bradysia coprophila]XP_037045333.1 uncharacterized protein LOC119080840 isoform X1 [Bradysia coprophila]XP_037045341.1 uncharacterized protein LOC119080840 isoform X1 [Bradysia coprophila]